MTGTKIHWQKDGTAHCGALITLGKVASSWADVTCLRCLGRPEEADVRDAFAPALELLIGCWSTNYRMGLADIKNATVQARNNAMAWVAKQVPADVKAAREAVRIATVEER